MIKAWHRVFSRAKFVSFAWFAHSMLVSLQSGNTSETGKLGRACKHACMAAGALEVGGCMTAARCTGYSVGHVCTCVSGPARF